MTQLAASVDDVETLWTVDAVPDPEFGYYTVGSEIVQVIAGFPGGDPGYAVGQTFPSKIRVIRGTNDTTAASHLSGVALTAANAFSGGGGALSVTGTQAGIPLTNVTSLIVQGSPTADGDEVTLGGATWIIPDDDSQTLSIVGGMAINPDDDRVLLFLNPSEAQAQTQPIQQVDTQAGTVFRIGGTGALLVAPGNVEQIKATNQDLTLGGAAGIFIDSSVIAFFGANGAGQSTAIANATDPASTMARLNDLLAYLRLLGLIAP